MWFKKPKESAPKSEFERIRKEMGTTIGELNVEKTPDGAMHRLTLAEPKLREFQAIRNPNFILGAGFDAHDNSKWVTITLPVASDSIMFDMDNIEVLAKELLALRAKLLTVDPNQVMQSMKEKN